MKILHVKGWGISRKAKGSGIEIKTIPIWIDNPDFEIGIGLIHKVIIGTKIEIELADQDQNRIGLTVSKI